MDWRRAGGPPPAWRRFSSSNAATGKYTSPRASRISGVSPGVRPSSCGNRRDGPHVRGHVLADPAVATGRAADEAAPLVGERDRQAVDLRLADEGRSVLGSEQPLQAAPQARISSSVVTLSRLIMGVRCATAANSTDGAIPTVCVGESASTSSGCCSSSVSSSSLSASYSAVGDVGGVLEVVLRVVALDEPPQLGDAGDGAGGARCVSLLTRAMVGEGGARPAQAAMPEPTTSSPP